MINTTTHPNLSPDYIANFNLVDSFINIISDYLTRNNIEHTILYDSDGKYSDFHIIRTNKHQLVIRTDIRNPNKPEINLEPNPLI